MTLWMFARPWLGFVAFLYEMLQPLFHRPVEPLIVGGSMAMMSLELLSRADKKRPGE